MSVEASEAVTEVWTRWQGHVINSTFPLGRCLGFSDHSGVFLTRTTARGPADVAIKLVPTNRALAELLLPRWKRAGSLAHPHLLPLLQWGGCQLEGLPYLYALMEYADQTLAQLLAYRAMTDDEARQMLPPMLDALTYLHRQDLVQGQLKPTNILVVGDQLKLSSDTVRRLSEGAISTHAPTPYDPPEARQGSTAPTGDIWALGVTLFEALTRRLPSGLGERGEAPSLPADFSPVFRDIVARCLSPDPQDRPSVAELAAFARGQSAEPAASATLELPAFVRPEPMALEPMTPDVVTPLHIRSRPMTPEPLPPAPEPLATLPAQVVPADAEPAEEPREPRSTLTLILGVLVILAVVWAAVRVFSGHGVPAPAPPPPPPPVETPIAPAAAKRELPMKLTDSAGPVAEGSITRTPRSEGVPVGGVHEVIPDVPWNARRTIHGHIKVWVRVIVNRDGSVFAASPDRAGSSRYFDRVAIEAAKKWTFPPVKTASQRYMQIRFDFTREGATARTVPLR